MTVRPILVDKPRRDGQHLIRFYIYNEGKRSYQSSGIHVFTSDWDANRGRIKASNPFSKTLNSKLARQEILIQQRELGINSSLIEFIGSYIDECKKGLQDISIGTVNTYRSHLKSLENYAQTNGLDDITFLDITMEFYIGYTNFLADSGCSVAGIGSHIKRLKKFMGEAMGRKLHNNNTFNQKEFKRPKSRNSDKIYLTREEINQLIDVDLRESQSGYSQERDRWLIGYFLLMRYTDTLKIREDQFFTLEGRKYYRNNAQKTTQTKYVPVSPTAWEILQRNDFKFSGANQVANRYIKDIAKMAGIDTLISGQPKYEFISTHTARRSMATQLHQSGMDIKTIMQLGGWKSEVAIKAYLLSSDIQLAKQAAENELFQ